MDTTGKKKLWIFIAVAYGVTALMSIFMYIGLKGDRDLTAFVNTQMMYPACGVILGKIITRKEDDRLPMGGFITVLVTTALMILISIMSVFIRLEPIEVLGQKFDMWTIISQYPLLLGSLVAYILFWTCGKVSRRKHGLSHDNIGLSVLMIVIFIALYIGRIMISITLTDLTNGNDEAWQSLLKGITNIGFWINMVILPVNYIFVFLAFFGEEYGWRYYLQPLMQKKFGKRCGVLLLGLVWAIWHIDADFMFYTTTNGLQMFICQIITCTVIAIFFGYAYMKTQNIWVPVIMHYLNNNIAALLAGGGADALQDQKVEWGDIPLFLLSSIAFALFIFMPVYWKRRGAEKEIPTVSDKPV